MEQIKVNLFKNKKKEKETSPYFVGSTKVGEEWKNIASGWINKTKNGDQYISVLFDVNHLKELLVGEPVESSEKKAPKLNIRKQKAMDASSKEKVSSETVMDMDDLPF